jgi:cytochrome c551/c552
MLLGASRLYGQADQNALAKRGKSLWTNKGCGACHAVGKKLAGPDLAGVSQRRTREWLGKFLKTTNQMLATDPAAMALLKEWKGTKMPQVAMTDADIDAVLAHIKAEEGKAKK